MEPCLAFSPHLYSPNRCQTCKCAKNLHPDADVGGNAKPNAPKRKTSATAFLAGLSGDSTKRKGSNFSKLSDRRASVFSGGVLMEGYLEKKSTGKITQYQSRFFQISGHYLK